MPYLQTLQWEESPLRLVKKIEIIGRNYDDRVKGKIKETFFINKLKPSLNKQDKSFSIKLINWYCYFKCDFSMCI